MADATTTYYGIDVPTKHNPISRYNVDVPEHVPELKPGGKFGASTLQKLIPEEKDCIMLYVLINMEEVVIFAR